MPVSATDLQPIVAGFDATGDWHDGGNGRYAPKGWSSAKALALRSIRGAFARDVAKEEFKREALVNERGQWAGEYSTTYNPVWLEAADDYLSRVGVAKGHAVKVTYLDDTYGAIDAVQPDGQTRPVKVKWERFADHLPAPPGNLIRTALETGPTHKLLDDGTWTDFRPDNEVEQTVREAFEHDLGGGYYSTATVSLSSGNSAFYRDAVNHFAVTVNFHRRSDGQPPEAEVGPGVTRSDVGGAWRTIALTHDGRVVLSNDNIKINGNAPKGTGTRFLFETERKLAALGVEEAEVGAMTDAGTGMVGAYVAARQGYSFGNPAAMGWELGYLMRQVDPGNVLAARLVAPYEARAAEIQRDDPEFTLTRKALVNSRKLFAGVGVPDDFPTPNEVALDPTGRAVLLGKAQVPGDDGEHDYEKPGGAFTWGGSKKLTPETTGGTRVERPTVTRNTTKADKGVGAGTAARIQAAGGTGEVTIADGYLARHGHPKGATATVTYVDDKYADVHPADGGRTIRSKWSHFADTAPATEPGVVPKLTEAQALAVSADQTGHLTRNEVAARHAIATPERMAALAESATDRPVVRAPAEAFAPILASGRFKSHHEEGVGSQGMFAPDIRVREEAARLGVPAGTDPTLRPIYGTVGDPAALAETNNYGEVLWYPKPAAVKGRTSVSIGDTMMTGVVPIFPEDVATASPERLAAAVDLADANTEIQIQGGLSLDDIDHIAVPDKPRPDGPTIDYRAALDAAGHPDIGVVTYPADWGDYGDYDSLHADYTALASGVPEPVSGVGRLVPDDLGRLRFEGDLDSIDNLTGMALTGEQITALSDQAWFHGSETPNWATPSTTTIRSTGKKVGNWAHIGTEQAAKDRINPENWDAGTAPENTVLYLTTLKRGTRIDPVLHDDRDLDEWSPPEPREYDAYAYVNRVEDKGSVSLFVNAENLNRPSRVAAEAPPVPEIPPVDVPRGTKPAGPMFHVGMVVGNSRLKNMPLGTRVRRNVDGEPYGPELKVDIAGLVDPDNNDRTPFMLPDEYIVTALPTDGYGPPPAGIDRRVRQALVDTARALNVPKLGVTKVAPTAVGETWPTDWAAAAQTWDRDLYPEVRDASQIIEGGARHYLSRRFPYGASGAEAVGPVWRVPGKGVSGNILWTDTPIEGVEPEVIAYGRIDGALTDTDGAILFGKDRRPVPWRDQQPSPVGDARLDAQVAAYRLPTQPAGDIDAIEVAYAPNAEAAALSWLHQPALPTITGPPVNGWTPSARPTVTGTVAGDRDLGDGPTRAVRFTLGDDGLPTITRMSYPIGSPEMDLAGWDPQADLILNVDDPRLPAAIDAAWWRVADAAGTVSKIEGQFIAVGDATSVESGHIEPRIMRALKANSDRLRSDALDAGGGDLKIAFRDGRYVLDPAGTIVQPGEVRYLRTDGTTTQVFLSRAGAEAVVGADAITPDYTEVMEAWRPWNERVAALATQRDKLLAGMPGVRLDHMFVPLTDKLEHDPRTVTATQQEQMDRAQAIAEFGKRLSGVAYSRSQEIERDTSYGPDRYIGGAWTPGGKAERDPIITPGHAKAMSKLVAAAAAAEPQAFESATARDLIDRLAQGKVRVDYKDSTTVDPSNPVASMASVMIYADQGLLARRRGAWIRVSFAGSGQIAHVEVHPPDKSDELAEEHAIAGWQAEPRVKAKWLKLAKDIGLVSKADPRPTLGELAFIETMEALGVNMETDPDVKIASSATKVGTIGHSTTPEVYAAQQGLNVYPRDWTSTLPQQTVELADDSFVLGGGGWNSDNGTTIHIADPRAHPEFRDTVVHEFGHSMESSVPGLTSAEAWYLMRRTLGAANGKPSAPVHRGEARGRDIYTYPADFQKDYSGRVYNDSSIAGNANYEVFTTAMQQIVNRGVGRGGVEDMELTGWVMGILGLIRPEAPK